MTATGPMQKHCQDCGAAFECGMGQDTPCWCSREFAPVVPLPDAGANCYCADCLKTHIARRQKEKAKTAPGLPD